MPVTGPVRHDETVPKKEFMIEPKPHAIVNGLRNVLWPAVFKIANPWPFWINKTVMANGITISIFAFRLNSGIKIVGEMGINSILLNISKLSEFKMIIIPTIKDPSKGGKNFLMGGVA